MNHTLKTIYVSIHDGQHFGEKPVIEMKIHKQEYLSHKDMETLRRRLEQFINNELEQIKRKPDYSGTYM